MSRMTNREHEEADHFQTRYEACYDTALDEYLTSIELIKQSFEHNLNETPICDVPLHVILHMATSVNQMVEKSNFHYVDEHDDVWYDFESELSEMLLDEYGWEL